MLRTVAVVVVTLEVLLAMGCALGPWIYHG